MKVEFVAIGTRWGPKRAASPVSRSKAARAVKKATTIAEVVKAASPIDRYARQSHAQLQTVPTAEQTRAEGGGVGGYLKAWRKLNQ